MNVKMGRKNEEETAFLVLETAGRREGGREGGREREREREREAVYKSHDLENVFPHPVSLPPFAWDSLPALFINLLWEKEGKRRGRGREKWEDVFFASPSLASRCSQGGGRRRRRRRRKLFQLDSSAKIKKISSPLSSLLFSFFPPGRCCAERPEQ